MADFKADETSEEIASFTGIGASVLAVGCGPARIPETAPPLKMGVPFARGEFLLAQPYSPEPFCFLGNTTSQSTCAVFIMKYASVRTDPIVIANPVNPVKKKL